MDGWRYAMIGDADSAALCGQVIRTSGKLDGKTDDPHALGKAVASVLAEPEEKDAGIWTDREYARTEPPGDVREDRRAIRRPAMSGG